MSSFKMLLYMYCRAGKPPPGLHLDVVKETKMVQVSEINGAYITEIITILYICIFFDRN